MSRKLQSNCISDQSFAAVVAADTSAAAVVAGGDAVAVDHDSCWTGSAMKIPSSSSILIYLGYLDQN